MVSGRGGAPLTVGDLLNRVWRHNHHASPPPGPLPGLNVISLEHGDRAGRYGRPTAIKVRPSVMIECIDLGVSMRPGAITQRPKVDTFGLAEEVTEHRALVSRLSVGFESQLPGSIPTPPRGCPEPYVDAK